eukprot:COSAG02_NODE_620_length_19443_cov_91.259564_4_plen_67_part_00
MDLEPPGGCAQLSGIVSFFETLGRENHGMCGTAKRQNGVQQHRNSQLHHKPLVPIDNIQALFWWEW